MYLLTGLHSTWIRPATWLLLTQHNWWGLKCVFISIAVHSQIQILPHWRLFASCIWEIASCSVALSMTHSQSLHSKTIAGRGNVMSVVIWVQNCGPPWFRVTSLSTQRQELGYEWNLFCNCMFAPNKEWTLATFMYYWMNSGNIHIYISIHALLELWAQKECNYPYTAVKVGGSVDQGPATEVTHPRVN